MSEQKIIQGDCLEVMRGFREKQFDLVLTDPPYGIGEDGGRFRDRKGGGHRVLPKGNWDNARPSKEYFDEMMRVSKNQVIFGGNYFTDYLPVSRGWIYWGKKMGGDFSDGELAWTSYDCVLKEFQLCNKMKGKQHPTEKPVELLKWIIALKLDGHYGDFSILDPFMGSGSTLVAAKDLSVSKTVGVEISPEYCEIARKRLEQEQLF
jgi:site-specific DNA-methyltransferase (adenine-specific)